MYVLLSEFLTKDSLDDLVAAFEQLADEMTPYFQERMRSLPAQQAKIIQTLCNADGGLSVKQVAETSFIPERNCSKQLGELKKKNLVQSEKRGKESYYDMSEPLMRLCLQVKQQRGKPLRLVAKFLSAWYPASSLEKRSEADGQASRANAYRSMALSLNPEFEELLTEQIWEQFNKCLSYCDLEGAKKLFGEIDFINPLDGIYARYRYHVQRGDQGEISADIAFLDGCLESEVEYTETSKAYILSIRGRLHSLIDFHHLAIENYLQALQHSTLDETLRHATLYTLGYSYEKTGQIDLATQAFSEVIEEIQLNITLGPIALLRRSFLFSDIDLRIKDLKRLIFQTEAITEIKEIALESLVLTYELELDEDSIITDLNKLLSKNNISNPLKSKALFLRASLQTFATREACEDAIQDLDDARELVSQESTNFTEATFGRLERILRLDSLDEVELAYIDAFETTDPEHNGYGGNPENQLLALLHRAPSEWVDFIQVITPLYIKYKVADKLGNGITQSIQYVDNEGFSESWRETWNCAWQQAGADCEDLLLPLRCLQAGIEVIKAGNDRPLFELPLEIRKLVKPLLTSTLPQEVDGG